MTSSGVQRFRPPDQSSREEGVSLLRLIAILRRRRWLFALVFLVGGGAAAGFAMSRPQSYRSEATVEVGPDNPMGHRDGATEMRSTLLWSNHLRTQESLLRRPGLLADVIDSLPPEQAAPYKAAPDPAHALSVGLEVDAIPSTFLIRITLRHDNKNHGPDIVNRIVDLFIEDSNQRLIELKNGARDLLSKESLPVLKQRMNEAEQALFGFHSKVGFGDLEDQYAGLLAERRLLHDRVVAVRIRSLELKSRPDSDPDLADPAAAADRTARAALEARRTDLEMEIASKKSELRERHPVLISLRERLETVKALIASKTASEIATRDKILKRLAEEETMLAGEERKMTERIASARELLAQYRGLDLEVRAARDLYNDYFKRFTEMKAIADAGLTSVRTVDRARTPQPFGLQPPMILALGLAIGIPMGLLAIFIAEQIDDRVPAPQEAEAALGLDLLAVIPKLSGPDGTTPLPLLPVDNPATAPLEPFRRLRSEVSSRLREIPGAKAVAILSPNYGEGKSTIAINLARVLALEGKRVLLFDVDLRQPSLKAYLGERDIPGLEQYLEGKVPIDRCIQRSRIPGVDILGPTWEFAGSAEVPGTVRFRAIWAAVRPSYDYIIVDTSPINVVSEAAVVASHVDASIFVMEERKTSIRQALSALRRVSSHQARPLGLVVNRSTFADAPRPEIERSRAELDRLAPVKT